MKQKAFTVIELLVVIAIIGMISTIVLVNLRGTKEKATVAKGLSFSQSIYHALGAYAVAIYRFETITGNPPFYKTTDASGYDNFLMGEGDIGCLSAPGIINNGWNHIVSCSWLRGGGLPRNFDFSETNEITIEAWFKLTGHSGVDMIVGIRKLAGPPPPVCAYRMMVSEDLHPLYNPGMCDSNQRITDFTFELNKWYHYVMTIKGREEAEIYINGKSVRKSSNEVPPTLFDGHEIIIGNDEEMNSFEGIIDEVRVYNQAVNL